MAQRLLRHEARAAAGSGASSREAENLHRSGKLTVSSDFGEFERCAKTPVGVVDGRAGDPFPVLPTASHVLGQVMYCVPAGAEAKTALSRLELTRNSVNGWSPFNCILTVRPGSAASRTCERGPVEIGAPSASDRPLCSWEIAPAIPIRTGNHVHSCAP